MIDISISNGIVTFESSVCGLINAPLNESELVDDDSFHLSTTLGTFLIGVKEFTINSIIFETANEAVTYIQSL